MELINEAILDLEIDLKSLTENDILENSKHIEILNERTYKFYGMSVLHWHCYKSTSKKSKLEKIKILINKGFDINELDKENHSAIAMACFTKDEKLIDYLLENGANMEKCLPLYSVLFIYNNIIYNFTLSE